MLAFVIFVGAGIGGVARYAVSTWIQSGAGAFPRGTLVVNATGCLLLTFVSGLLEGSATAAEWRAFLGVGVLGGYTTFSTFTYEAVRLLQDGDWKLALAYIGSSVIVSLVAAITGFRLAAGLLHRG